MVKAENRTIGFGLSPDPDDAYMFFGFSNGGITIPGYTVTPHHEDIEKLNERAFRGDYEVTSVSTHAFAYCSQRYWVMSSGASVGRRYGPVLLKKKGHRLPKVPKVAVPGKWTTAILVFDLWREETQEMNPEKIYMPFDQILTAITSGKVDAGIVIHEGQLTFAEKGLEKIWDAGEWWNDFMDLPLPLGLDIVRSDLGRRLAKDIDTAFKNSILYAKAHPKEALAYAMKFGRGLNEAQAQKFIDMYVNDDTLNQGKEVKEGLKQLYVKTRAAGLLPNLPEITFI